MVLPTVRDPLGFAIAIADELTLADNPSAFGSFHVVLTDILYQHCPRRGDLALLLEQKWGPNKIIR